MDWFQIFVNLVLTGVLLYVFQRVIDERSVKRLEKFKTELQSISFEHETKFSRLHEIRVEVVAGLYKRLFDTQQSLAEVQKTFSDEDLNQKIKPGFRKLQAVIVEFENYFNANRLYVPKHLCQKLDNFRMQAQEMENGFWELLFKRFAVKNIIDDGDDFLRLYEKSREEASLMLSNIITPMLGEIEKEFRSIIEN
jgi:hypothetical protein